MRNPARRGRVSEVRVDRTARGVEMPPPSPCLASTPCATPDASGTNAGGEIMTDTIRPQATDNQHTGPTATSGQTRCVYGYLRPTGSREHSEQQGQAEIVGYASSHGYRLAEIIIDRGGRHDDPARSGITGLLEAVHQPHVFGVIIPGRRHLSVDPDVLNRVIGEIMRAGCHLFVVSDGDLRSPDQPYPLTHQRLYGDRRVSS
jgi:hypothetical protein